MIILGFGANLDSRFGKPESTIEAAYSELIKAGIIIVKKSSIWMTAPVPISDQPWYKNSVCLIETKKNSQDILSIIRKIESDFGRLRTIQNAPRVIDIDLLCYDNLILNTQDLQIPHPRLHERAFVLYPISEIAPDWIHPQTGTHLRDYIKLLPQEQEIRIFEHA